MPVRAARPRDDTPLDDVVVVVPASKKTVAFPNDLVRRLDGVRLVERAVALARAVVEPDRVLVVTDSEEIEHIVAAHGVGVHRDAALRMEVASVWEDPAALAPLLAPGAHDVLVLSAYAPLIDAHDLRAAVGLRRERDVDVVLPGVDLAVRATSIAEPATWGALAAALAGGPVATWATAFVVVHRRALARGAEALSVATLALRAPVTEIRSYEDWWVCERLLQRRRVVFRVIGSTDDGSGHVHRALTLARDLHDHEVRFVCDTEAHLALRLLADSGYWVGAHPAGEVVDAIVALAPDLVINDVLDTTRDEVLALRASGARVVTFEDHGPGAAEADLVVHELLDDLDDDPRVLAGHAWFLLRDEFADVTAHRGPEPVRRVLVTFGGTDPGDLTSEVVAALAPWAAARGIAIDVVTGPGYLHVERLAALVATLPGEVTRTHATGTISRLMAGAQVAVCANGRTPYELAHMHLPAVVVTQNAREDAHPFADPLNGFVRLSGAEGSVGQRVLAEVTRMVDDEAHRRRLFEAMHGFDLSGNRRRVVERILALVAPGAPDVRSTPRTPSR